MTLRTRLDGSGTVGAVLVLAMVALAVLGPLVAQHDPNAIDLARRLQAPNGVHWFGTDELGRDLFARIASGGVRTLISAIAVVALVFSFGMMIGGGGAIVGGPVEGAVMRCADVLLSVPGLILALALAAALGPGLMNAVFALAIARLPLFVRLARNQAQIIRTQPYVDFARVNGATRRHILIHHVAPNAAPSLFVQAVSDISGVILAISALGFIGLGAQPPSAEWGSLAATGRLFILDAWWLSVVPGAAIALSAIGFTLLGDSLRDQFDPRARKRSVG